MQPPNPGIRKNWTIKIIEVESQASWSLKCNILDHQQHSFCHFKRSSIHFAPNAVWVKIFGGQKVGASYKLQPLCCQEGIFRYNLYSKNTA